MLSEEEQINRIRLILSENIGAVTYRHLISFYKNAASAILSLNDLARQGGRQKPIKIASVSQAEEQLSLAQKNNAEILFCREDGYPERLSHLSDAPPIIYVKGNKAALEKTGLSIVGTRNASVNGKILAKHFAHELAKKGYNVVSGMARGIDRAAHLGALESGELAATTAVLGTAVDEIYPAENKDIYSAISEKGCLLSEFPFRSVLTPRNFPRRNRIIAGLSVGTIVIEAQERSGSLITAHEALNQGAEVFAVPGSPVDPRSAGPNGLIRDGATLVMSPEDVVSSLENMNQLLFQEAWDDDIYDTIQLDEATLSDARAIVLQNLGPERVSIDDFVSETGIDIRLLNIVLVELELAGRLERHPGNRVSLIYTKE